MTRREKNMCDYMPINEPVDGDPYQRISPKPAPHYSDYELCLAEWADREAEWERKINEMLTLP